jgi:hypothetical protein
MLNKTTRLLGLVALGVLTGCGGGGGAAETPAEPAATVVTRLQTSGAMLPLDRSTDVAGPDANADGVRDDVSTWIGTQGYAGDLPKAAAQLAKAYQTVLTVALTDDTAVRAARLASSDAVECIMQKAASVEAGYKAVADLRRVTVNTDARVKAYLSYVEKVNDTVSRAPEGDGCV